jgi:hypothetical protein
LLLSLTALWEHIMTQWRDQQHMASMRSARTTALARVQEDVGPDAHRLLDRFSQVFDFQFMADFRYREAERLEAVGLDDGRAQAARRAGDRYNSACLDMLGSEVPAAIETVRQQLGGVAVDFHDSLVMLEQEGLEQVADMDFLKGEHAVEAARTLRETVAVANESGMDGLCNHLQDQASKLAELRRRRPEHNDPVAVVLGAVLCGIAATILGICWASSGPRGCTNTTALTLVGVLFALGAFVLATSLLALFAPAA